MQSQNPAFGLSQIRGVCDIFVDKAIQVQMLQTSLRYRRLTYAKLRDLWSTELTDATEYTRLDVLQGLTKATLDVIGLAGTPSTAAFHTDLDSSLCVGRQASTTISSRSTCMERLTNSAPHLRRCSTTTSGEGRSSSLSWMIPS